MRFPAHDVYSSELRELDHGHALWCPEPWGYDEVRVGDVGYLWRGAFYRLFNATLSADDPSHTRFGVPDGFEPLLLPADMIYRNEKYFDPGRLRTSSVSEFKYGFSATGALLPGGAGIRFSCSTRRGAVLVLTRRGIREDIILREALEEYVLSNFRSWYHFANGRHRRGVKNGEIMIVSGCDKTAEWASAVFDEKGKNGGISFSGGLPMASGEVTVSGNWERNTSVQHRSGPVCGDLVKWDQTIFIRGFRIRERKLFSPKIIRGGAEPRPPGAKHQGPDEFSLMNNDGNSAGSSEELVVEALHREQPDFHPTDALLEYILDHSDTPVAIAHDDDWRDGTATCSRLPGSPSVTSILEEYTQRFFRQTQGETAEESPSWYSSGFGGSAFQNLFGPRGRDGQRTRKKRSLSLPIKRPVSPSGVHKWQRSISATPDLETTPSIFPPIALYHVDSNPAPAEPLLEDVSSTTPEPKPIMDNGETHKPETNSDEDSGPSRILDSMGNRDQEKLASLEPRPSVSQEWQGPNRKTRKPNNPWYPKLAENARVYFWGINGQIQYGKVQLSTRTNDGTLIVVVLADDGKKVTLPLAGVTLVK